jgi:hypothetical protein
MHIHIAQSTSKHGFDKKINYEGKGYDKKNQ